MSETSTTYNGGVGVFGLLGVVFVVLKLPGYIDWSWWWVTAPFWGGLALALAIFLIIVCVGFVVVSIERLFKRWS